MNEHRVLLVSHSCVWQALFVFRHDLFICVWRCWCVWTGASPHLYYVVFYSCDMWRALSVCATWLFLTCATWLIYTCDMPFHVTCLIRVCDVTHSYMRDMTQLYVWHAFSICMRQLHLHIHHKTHSKSAPWFSHMRAIPYLSVRWDSYIYAQHALYSWTGASPHFHYASFRSMVFGRARWFLWPPARAFYSTRDIYDWFLSEYPMLRYIYIFIYTCVCVCIHIHICTCMYIFGCSW